MTMLTSMQVMIKMMTIMMMMMMMMTILMIKMMVGDDGDYVTDGGVDGCDGHDGDDGHVIDVMIQIQNDDDKNHDGR